MKSTKNFRNLQQNIELVLLNWKLYRIPNSLNKNQLEEPFFYHNYKNFHSCKYRGSPCRSQAKKLVLSCFLKSGHIFHFCFDRLNNSFNIILLYQNSLLKNTEMIATFKVEKAFLKELRGFSFIKTRVEPSR